MGAANEAWYRQHAITYGPWIVMEQPTEREIAARLKRDGIDCGRGKARRLRDRCTRPSPPARRGPTILVVGDAHFEPGQDMRRASWLGRYIREHLSQDDHVVQLGDWFGNTSVCKHLKPKEKEGLRLVDDLRAGNLAVEIVEAELGPPETQPEKHAICGNHCARPKFFVEEHPQFEGLIGDHLMRWEEHGWAYYDFLEPCRIEGWRFQHYMPTKMGRAISGVNMVDAIMRQIRFSESFVVGHGHELRLRTYASTAAGRRWGAMAGCFFEHDEDYAGPDANDEWWRGLMRIDNAVDGDGAISFIPMADLREMYG